MVDLSWRYQDTFTVTGTANVFIAAIKKYCIALYTVMYRLSGLSNQNNSDTCITEEYAERTFKLLPHIDEPSGTLHHHKRVWMY